MILGDEGLIGLEYVKWFTGSKVGTYHIRKIFIY